MAIKFSNNPVVFTTVRGDTSAHLRADINTVLISVGWLQVRTITNGIVYSLTSPEALGARCRIQDVGTMSFGYGLLEIQFMSVDESRLGYVHRLVIGAISSFNIIAGISQMFISQNAHTNDSGVAFILRNYVAGGVPFAGVAGRDGACAAESIGSPDRWWSSSIETEAVQCFRTSLYCTAYYSVFFNGNLYVHSGGAEEGVASLPLRLVAFTPTDETPDSYFGAAAPIYKYGTSTPLNIDAMVAFRDYIFGQLWDAFIQTKQYPVETIISSLEGDTTIYWRSFNYGAPSTGYLGATLGDHTYFGTLFLAQGFPDSSGGAERSLNNYVY